MNITRIEISFPMDVELSQDHQKEFQLLVSKICNQYEATHPGRVMWPFGVGSKPLFNPCSIQDDDPMEFDVKVFHIECTERAK